MTTYKTIIKLHTVQTTEYRHSILNIWITKLQITTTTRDYHSTAKEQHNKLCVGKAY